MVEFVCCAHLASRIPLRLTFRILRSQRRQADKLRGDPRGLRGRRARAVRGGAGEGARGEGDVHHHRAAAARRRDGPLDHRRQLLTQNGRRQRARVRGVRLLVARPARLLPAAVRRLDILHGTLHHQLERRPLLSVPGERAISRPQMQRSLTALLPLLQVERDPKKLEKIPNYLSYSSPVALVYTKNTRTKYLQRTVTLLAATFCAWRIYETCK